MNYPNIAADFAEKHRWMIPEGIEPRYFSAARLLMIS